MAGWPSKIVYLLCLAWLLGLPGAPAVFAQPRPANAVTLLTVDGPIGPAYADYVERGIAAAAARGHRLVVLQIDTPGGLDTAMRVTVRAILAAPIPVACFVAPGGARAASAGTYILYACHVAAMAPGTNLGAATPVQVGAGPDPPAVKPGDDKPRQPSTLESKAVNDAAAYLRGLAQLRGRNAVWAEAAVRQSVSLSAEDALAAKVVDHVARDVPGLLAQANGRSVSVRGQPWRIDSAGVAIVDTPPDWRTRLLAAITNPSVALILLSVGVYGLLFEFMSPGAVLPGVVGAICLLLGLYGLQLLPINYSGLALIFFGLACMVAEAFLPSFGVIGFGGVVAFVIGALLLFDSEAPGFGLPLGLVGGVAVVAALLVGATAHVAMRTRRRPRVGALASIEGSIGEVLGNGAGEGDGNPTSGIWANVGGETWQVTADTPLVRGERVRVLGRRGRVLLVAPLGQGPPAGKEPSTDGYS
ncbi:nodulation protein NfeD [Massilia sp. CFBP 13647]|nr:nodulation protein NfeD [Massilia sp. CFBP 13647]MBD8672279.1 nodulation protein NfeD [Massilia sp. CFBP 13721]